MDAAEIDRAAGLLCRNRLAPGPFDGLPAPCRPGTEADGYAIQAALARRLGDAGLGPPAGAKIGCTTPVMQAFMKIGSPCAGTMYHGGLRHGHGALRHRDFHHVGVECEIAVRLAADLPPAAAPYRRDDVALAVGACMAAIEIVDDRYRDFRSLDVATLIADDFFHAGAVLGAPVSDWRGLDLAGARGGMTINGEPVGTGHGADIMGHPFEALAWLANAQGLQNRRLAADAVILLGSVVETRWVTAGDTVEIAVDGLGTATANFA